jgi:SepF-like predicted cell division protein (DUF552 family)
MVLKKIKEKISAPKVEEEFVEITEEPREEKKVNVRVEILRDSQDVERVQTMLREGTVVFLKIKELRNKDINELKRVTDRLKKTVTAMNGDIVGVDEDFLILVPSFAKIYRGK